METSNPLTYQEALDYLYNFIDYSVERSYRYSADVFDLSRVSDLLHRLGDPQDQYHSVHIAGTKGKGSVGALTSSCLRAAGYSTGLYTSPHLMRFTERIQINGVEITEKQVAELVSELQPHVKAIPGLTTYELITTLGFLHFARQNVDIAVIEVGLGGRLDATNVLNPIVSIITSLSYDHMHLLGDSLSDIAREKGGIIKPDTPVVTAPQQYEAQQVLSEIAEAQNSELIRIGREWHYLPGSHNTRSQFVSIWSADEQPLMDEFVDSTGEEEWVPPRYELPLLGYHQVINAATAYAALQVIKQQGLVVKEEHILAGFKSVEWKGRFQILPSDPVVIIDSAHNRDSALKLRIALDDYFPGQSVTLIFGVSADKDLQGMFAELLPRVDRIIVTQADHPRAAELETLAEHARTYGLKAEAISPVSDALEFAMETTRGDAVILVAGSLFVAGEVLSAWEKLKMVEQDPSPVTKQ
jgi:dihydrofolate synthase / folylpolyglutamate synthase